MADEPKTSVEEKPSETDTLDVLSLSDEELDRRLAEASGEETGEKATSKKDEKTFQAGKEGDQGADKTKGQEKTSQEKTPEKPESSQGKETKAQGQDKTDKPAGEKPSGEAGKGQEQPPEPELPDFVKSMIPERFKGSLKEFLKHNENLEQLLVRQGTELGGLRKQIEESKAKPKADIKPDGKPSEGKFPEEITDEMIQTAMYEDMDANKAFNLWAERERRKQEKDNATQEETARTEQEQKQALQAYEKALSDGFQILCKDIPGFGDPNKPGELGETAVKIIEYGKKNGFITSDEHLERIAADPINGPAIVRSIHRLMKQEADHQAQIGELNQKVADLQKANGKTAEDVAKKINEATNAPVVLSGGAGSSQGGETGEIPAMTDEQIGKLSDKDLNEYLAKAS